MYIARSLVNTCIRRQLSKDRLWKYRAEHPCVDCGETDPLILEFDHVSPDNKRSEIYCLANKTYAWTAILAEIERCEVRCANCHRRPVRLAKVRVRPRRTGSVRTHRSRLDPPNHPMLAAGLRICARCGIAKAVEQFSFINQARARRDSICSECLTVCRREHYRLSRQDYLQRKNRVLRGR